jgi:hypothetical protein
MADTVTVAANSVGAGPGKYNMADIKSLAWNGLVIGFGALATYLLQNAIPVIPARVNPILATAIITYALKLINKFVSNSQVPIAK